MSYDDEREMAKQCAMTDIGLTEDEAEFAVDTYYSEDFNRYCKNCGVELDEWLNCNNQFIDDYCDKCWKVMLKKRKED